MNNLRCKFVSVLVRQQAAILQIVTSRVDLDVHRRTLVASAAGAIPLRAVRAVLPLVTRDSCGVHRKVRIFADLSSEVFRLVHDLKHFYNRFQNMNNLRCKFISVLVRQQAAILQIVTGRVDLDTHRRSLVASAAGAVPLRAVRAVLPLVTRDSRGVHCKVRIFADLSSEVFRLIFYRHGCRGC